MQLRELHQTVSRLCVCPIAQPRDRQRDKPENSPRTVSAVDMRRTAVMRTSTRTSWALCIPTNVWLSSVNDDCYHAWMYDLLDCFRKSKGYPPDSNWRYVSMSLCAPDCTIFLFLTFLMGFFVLISVDSWLTPEDSFLLAVVGMRGEGTCTFWKINSGGKSGSGK